MKLLILSCDKYEPCWKPFFILLKKYYPNYPKTYLITETKKCSYCETINIKSSIWTERFREGLKQIEDNEILIMLDDFFIRKPVDEKRINNIKMQDGVACYNFEINYREAAKKLNNGWDIQKNNQIYLTSTQPSLWRKDYLLSFLNKNMTPWEFETQIINSPYVFFINNQDFIIDIGYRHQDISIGWGITRGKITKECISFLKKEQIDIQELERVFNIL